MGLFRSVKSNVWLFCALMLASAVGTFLPQAPESPERVDAFLRAYPALGRLLRAAGLFDVYYSRWYVALLVLMSFDTILCTTVRLASGASRERLDSIERDIQEQSLATEWTAAVRPEEAVFRLRGFLAGRGFRLQPVLGDAAGRAAFVATRHGLQWWGTVLAHVSLVVMLAGGAAKALFGFTELVPVAEGECREVRSRPGWSLCLQRFTVEYYEDTGAPKLFASDLRLMGGGGPLAAGRIAVNSPLAAHGVRFYQSSWGATGDLRRAALRVASKEIALTPGKPAPLPGAPVSVTLTGFAPSLAVAEDGRADNDSYEMQNPAVRLSLAVRGGPIRILWLLLRHPESAFTEDADGVLHRAPAPPFRLSGVDAVLFSGVEAGYDPGYPLVLGGALAWLAGMVLLFYLHRRSLWVLAVHAGNGTRFKVGAWSSRGAAAYKREFENLMSRAGQEAGK